MTAITAPGIYDDLAADIYHGNCTPAPALSSSGARTIASECLHLFWWESPLNPDREPVERGDFDIGTAAHLIALEPERFAATTVVIEADAWRTKEAKAARDAAREVGKVPLLRKDADLIQRMRSPLLAHPIAGLAFAGAIVERSYIWIDEEFGCWRKARPDIDPPSPAFAIDYKTSTSANPRAFARRLNDIGYHAQAAWIMDAREALTGVRPREFFFIVQSIKPPFLVSVCRVSDVAIEAGRLINREALEQFSTACRDGNWQRGYTDDEAAVVSIPRWAEIELEQRLAGHAFVNPIHARAFNAQSPKRVA